MELVIFFLLLHFVAGIGVVGSIALTFVATYMFNNPFFGDGD